MNTEAIASAYSRQMRLNLIVIKGWFWVGMSILIMFLMGYSVGLHANQPYHILHYPLVAFSILYFLVAGHIQRRPLLRFRLTAAVIFSGGFFFYALLMSAIIGNRGYFSAIHIFGWHTAILLFWMLFQNYVGHSPINGIVASWLSVVILALLSLIIGLYIRHVGILSLGPVIFAQPMRNEIEYARLISWFSSPNRTGPFLMYGLIGCVFIMPWINSRLQKGVLWFIAVILGAGILLVASRSAIFSAMTFLFVVSLFHLPKTLLRAHNVILTLLLVGGLTSIVVVTDIGPGLLAISRLDEPVFDYQGGVIVIDNRYAVFARAIDEYIDAHPIQKIWGIGPGGVIEETAVSAHSGWLQVFVQQGIFGFILLLFFFLSVIAHTLNQYMRHRTSPMIRRFYINQLAFWLAFAALNITTAIFTIPRLDSLIMIMALAQLGVMNAAVRRHKAYQN